jgi:hypothetical protein
MAGQLDVAAAPTAARRVGFAGVDRPVHATQDRDHEGCRPGPAEVRLGEPLQQAVSQVGLVELHDDSPRRRAERPAPGHAPGRAKERQHEAERILEGSGSELAARRRRVRRRGAPRGLGLLGPGIS